MSAFCFVTQLHPEWSRSEDDEAPSCYEGPGKVSLRLTHNEDLLSVHIINCKGLPANCRWTARGPQFFRRSAHSNELATLRLSADIPSKGPSYHRNGQLNFFIDRNPFVRITLLPDTGAAEETVSTKERHKTLNPNFDETFQLPVGTHELQDRAIRISVFDKEEGKNPKVHPTLTSSCIRLRYRLQSVVADVGLRRKNVVSSVDDRNGHSSVGPCGNCG